MSERNPLRPNVIARPPVWPWASRTSASRLRNEARDKPAIPPPRIPMSAFTRGHSSGCRRSSQPGSRRSPGIAAFGGEIQALLGAARRMAMYAAAPRAVGAAPQAMYVELLRFARDLVDLEKSSLEEAMRTAAPY